MTDTKKLCKLCGEPMHPSEDMFNYHGYSGPCPKPPLDKRKGTMTDTKNIPPVDVEALWFDVEQISDQFGWRNEQLLALVELWREYRRLQEKGISMMSPEENELDRLCGMASERRPRRGIING